MKTTLMRAIFALLVCLCVGQNRVLGVTLTCGMAGFDVRWQWDSDTRTLTFSGTGDMADFSFTTPWDRYKSSVRTAVVEEGVTSVGSYVLSSCKNLTEVQLPESLKKIRFYAFNGSSSLSSIRLPEGVEYIDTGAFMDCSRLASVNIPAAVTYADKSV